MKEKAISKINSLGKVGYVIAVIAKVLMIIAACAVALGAVVMFVIPDGIVDFDIKTSNEINYDFENLFETFGFTQDDIDSFIDEINESITSGDMQASFDSARVERLEITEDGFIIETDAVPVRINADKIGAILIIAMLQVVVGIVCMCFVCRLCKALRECATPYGDNVIKSLSRMTYAIIGWVAAGMVFDNVSSAVMSGDVNITLNVDFITAVAVLLLFAATYILKYGAVLQQESDETL